MRMTDFFDRELGSRQVVRFFLIATMLYILPLILADFPYIDDTWRSLAAGDAWTERGRLFMDWLYHALTFTGAAPNIFPLPLLIATVAMSLALSRLTFHYFPEPTLASCLVALPLWYNPFLLQNLSYQYDGAGMALSLVAVIYAITFGGTSRIQRWLVPSVLLALATGLYQISLNVFLGLACVELLRAVHRRLPWAELWPLAGWKLAQLALGVSIYSVTAFPFTDFERTELLDFSADSLLQISTSFADIMKQVALLFHGGYTAVFVVLLGCALVGVAGLGRRIRLRGDSPAKGLLLGLMCLLTLPLIVLLVPGMTLLFRDFNEGARTLMGFGVLLMLLFYLAYLGLAPLHRFLPLTLAIPLLATLSLSFAYGRVLTMEKTFASSALYSLSHDISSHRELREAKRIYLSGSDSDRWLVSATGTFKQLPVLRYLLSIGYFMLPENLPSAGITNVVAEPEQGSPDRVDYQGFPVLVDSLYYRIYLSGDTGYIVVKEPPRGRVLQW